MMPRTRPQLSITLPRNFTFHYTEGEEPKTPEREIPVQIPQSPNGNGAYRIKKRSRVAVMSALQNKSPEDIPIPTIETPLSVEPIRPPLQQRITEPVEGYLSSPLAGRRFMTLPKTPVAQQRDLTNGWNPSNQHDMGDSISRPMSACSLISDSSDDSNGSLASYPTGDGSCTSPESDAPDPFRFSSIKKSKANQWAELARNSDSSGSGLIFKQTRVNWTPDMDKHLWSVYHTYLQDPTVTPFKMLPGVAPPLGVCHRVAREARRSWRGGKAISQKSAQLLSPPSMGSEGNPVRLDQSRPNSPDTIRAHRSGSNTPTGTRCSKASEWPKSGASTRRRLRHLCKIKPTIAPHYQRLLQSRSPSPFSPNSRPQSRSNSRLSEVSSPFEQKPSSFKTRDIQLSLTTSTAASMQPHGPLAQLASRSSENTQESEEWFNAPPAPWASPTAIPSDTNDGVGEREDLMQTPRLSSPFNYHTWGPSRSHQRLSPTTSRICSSDASTIGPSLRSPIRLHETFPYPGVHKRRARHQLEDELSPGGSSMQQSLLDNLFGNPAESRHRRVRSRGFSLGDVNCSSLDHIFTTSSTSDVVDDPGNLTDRSRTEQQGPSSPTATIARLGSPFHAVAPNPTRRPSRHVATMSLGSYDPSAFSSIGETLGQAINTNGVECNQIYQAP